jgi:stage III sporulation protein AD
MNIISIIALALIIAVFNGILRRYLPEYNLVFTVASCIALISILLPQIIKVLNEIKLISRTAKFSEETQIILLKTIGICILTQFAADSCQDSGEKALANKIELAGKIIAILTAMPLFKKIIEIVTFFFNS